MLKDDEMVAMAVVAIAEEMKIDIRKIKVKSFYEVQKSNLEKYIEENNIYYSKYKLGDMTL
jgi:uncharacterized OsmC-like protein